MVAVDYLDPLELCPNDPAEGERVKIAVHALMLNPNDYQARFLLLQYTFGENALFYIGKNPVFQEMRDQDREFFELANQVAMAFCCYKLARCIHKYDRHKYSLHSFIWHVYRYAKDTVKGYARTAPGAHAIPDPDNPQKVREYIVSLNSDARDTLTYHMVTQWVEAVSSVLSRHAADFGVPADIVRTRQVGGVTEVVTAPDGLQHHIRRGHHEEQLLYDTLDMSPEECDRALAALNEHHAPLYSEDPAKRHSTLSAEEFGSFTRFYLENSKNNTFNQAVNNEVNLEIGRLYLCESTSLAGILDTLGPDYPQQVAMKLDNPSNAKKPEPLTPVKVRSRVYQNILPMLTDFMKKRESCISMKASSPPSSAMEGSSACDI